MWHTHTTAVAAVAAYLAVLASGSPNYDDLVLEHGEEFNIADGSCAPPVLSQHDCGSCYAFSTATTIGTSACIQKGPNNTDQAVHLSPQFMLGVKYGDPTPKNDDKWIVRKNPCKGGFPLSLMWETANFCKNFPNYCGWDTCDEQCTTGCLNYTEGDCPLKMGPEYISSYNGFRDCDGYCKECPPFALKSSTTSCSEPALRDNTYLPIGVPLSTAIDDFTFANIKAASTTVVHSFAVDNLLQGHATINRTMVWLKTRGPVSVAIHAACHDFVAYWNKQNFWLDDEYTTVGVMGCNTKIDHAVTIVGWNQIGGNGEPSWIIQNSWGTEGGFGGGYFYVPFSQVGYVGTDALTTSNKFLIAFPIGALFTSDYPASRSQRSLDPDMPKSLDTEMASRIGVLGGEHLVTDPEKLRTLTVHVAAKLSERAGVAMTVTAVHNVTMQVTSKVVYRVYATVAPADGSAASKTVVVMLSLSVHTNGYDYIQHVTVATVNATKASNEPQDELQVRLAGLSGSASDTLDWAIPTIAAAMVVVIIVAYVIGSKRQRATNADEDAASPGAEEVHV
eukprot:m.14202 g.14202  ORF g.14202 m.14202 type:complete len:562 (-) comp10042_c0_seq1:307-1992(-)